MWRDIHIATHNSDYMAQLDYSATLNGAHHFCNVIGVEKGVIGILFGGSAREQNLV
jgi:hypothetical protein